MDLCQVCSKGGDSVKKCAGCFNVFYCSVDHQKQHWKIHKKECHPFKITLDPVLGKQWTATKDLKPGTLLLTEEPLVFYPRWTGNKFVCLSCGFDFKGLKPRVCSTCRWPVCSPKCEQMPMHKDNECFVFNSQNIEFVQFYDAGLDDDHQLLSNTIEFIRGLGLKKRNPKLYNELLSENYGLNGVYDAEYMEKFKLDITFLRMLIDINVMMEGHGTVDDEELLRFRKTSSGSNFGYCDEDGTKRDIDLLYIVSGRMNHSCSPNSVGISLPYPHLRKVRTTIEVTKGQALTFNYFSPGFERWSRGHRQMETFTKWRFQCKCQRCVDPTELKSYMEGVACAECRPDGILQQQQQQSDQNCANDPKEEKNMGYLLPLNPLDLQPTSQWQCNRCMTTKPFRFFTELLLELNNELKTIKLASNENNNRLVLWETFERKCGSILHPNHWILMEAAKGIIDTFDEEPEGACCNHCRMTRPQFDKLIEKRQYLVDIDKIIAPGLSQTRADPLAQLGVIQLVAVEMKWEDYTKKEKLNLLTTSLEYFKEAAVVFDQNKSFLVFHKERSDLIAKAIVTCEALIRQVG